MTRIDLQVPFAEKDDAKRLGARWDAQQRVWYIPDGIAIAPFQKWLPADPSINIRSSSYFVAESRTACWKCDALTPVYGFLLPKGYEIIEDAAPDDADASYEWTVVNEPTIIHYIAYLPTSIKARIAAFTRTYRVDFSKTTQSSYWMNHCESCGMKQGDFEMYCEPEGAFLPLYERDAKCILLYLIRAPFEARCGSWSYGVEWFNAMRQA